MNEDKGRSLRDRLYTHDVLVGLLQMYPNPLLAELAGPCGYDFLFLDGEHGVLSEADFATSLKALAEADALGLVRLAGHDAKAMRRFVELGADGVVVPHVSTVEEASSLAGVLDSRHDVSLVVIIESKLGVDNAEAIFKVEGVEAAIIGPHDLTSDLGCPGEFAHPEYTQAFARIEHAAAVTGKALGTVPHGSFTLEVLRARGHRLLILGGDRSLLREAMSAQTAKARAKYV